LYYNIHKTIPFSKHIQQSVSLKSTIRNPPVKEGIYSFVFIIALILLIIDDFWFDHHIAWGEDLFFALIWPITIIIIIHFIKNLPPWVSPISTSTTST